MELNELAALRARMGGGVTERLEGVVEGVDPEQQFLESLKTLVQSQKSPELELLPSKNPSTDGTIVATVGATATSAGERSEAAKAEYAQRVLRGSAKKLEQLAAELEQAQFYDKADQLRQTAAKYWLQARTMD